MKNTSDKHYLQQVVTITEHDTYGHIWKEILGTHFEVIVLLGSAAVVVLGAVSIHCEGLLGVIALLSEFISHFTDNIFLGWGNIILSRI